jgi:TolB protein
MDAMGVNIRRLTFEGEYNDGADWSPRGDKICFTSQTETGFQIGVIDVATAQTVYLTGVGNNENPYWSPDGYHIVFTSDRTGKYQIYTMSWDGNDVKRITDSGSNTAPAWSPRFKWSFE